MLRGFCTAAITRVSTGSASAARDGNGWYRPSHQFAVLSDGVEAIVFTVRHSDKFNESSTESCLGWSKPNH